MRLAGFARWQHVDHAARAHERLHPERRRQCARARAWLVANDVLACSSVQAAAWPIENAPAEAFRHFRIQQQGMTSEGGFGHLVCAGIEIWGRVRRINDIA